MNDRFIQRQLYACVHLLIFSLKKTSRKLLTGLLPNFILVFLRSKNLFIVTEKSDLWSNTGAQAPLVTQCFQKPSN